jgi:hypothetical protein
MVMIGHAQRLSQPLTRRQRRLIAISLVVVAALAAWAIARSSGAPASRSGCVNVVVASSTGGGLLSECGAAARSWCASELRHSDALARRIEAQCRLAGVLPKR